MKKIRFFTHTESLFSLFILGNAVITLPVKDASKLTFLAYIFSSLFGVALYLICFLVAKKLFAKPLHTKMTPYAKIALGVLYFLVAVLSIFCAADTFYDFIRFAKDMVLKDTPMFLICVLFLAVSVYFCLHRQEDTLKFFLVSFWVLTFIILFFFVASAFKFELKNIFIFEFPNFKTLFLQSGDYILNPVIPSVLLSVYTVSVFGEKSKSHWLGCVFGYFLLGLTVLSGVLVFGASLAGSFDYPYSYAISTVSIGRLFTRLDGFSYFVYFITSLAKITVCIFILKSIIKRIKVLIK